MPSVTIRVGCALDSSMSSVMKPWIAAVKDARAQVAREMNAAEKDMLTGAQKGAKGAADAHEKIKKSGEDAAKGVGAAFRAAGDDGARAWQRMATSATASFSAIMRGYKTTFGSIARGAGINFDVGTNVAAAIRSQSATALLANKGFLEGA